jgi:DNA replication protein DnaC
VRALIVSGKSVRASRELEIPRRFWGKSLANFEGFAPEIDKGLRAIGSGKSIFITGLCGSGKTHLAVAFLLDWYGSGVAATMNSGGGKPSAMFLAAAELYVEFRENFDVPGGEARILNKYTRELEMLCLDDLGAEKITDWSRQMLYLIIDRRYRDIRPSIITSNLTIKQIAQQVDDRIASRIAETSEVIKLTAEDRRLG